MDRMAVESVQLYCATSNPGKAREFDDAARQLGFPHIRIEQLCGTHDILPPEETGDTFLDNAILKAIYYSKCCDRIVFTDDSGLRVAALDGAPGVFSARFGGAGIDDAARVNLLLKRMEGKDDRSAEFVCAIAVAARGKLLSSFEGYVAGKVLHEPRGAGGFGYDPVFLYEPAGMTFSEMEASKKLRISHRGMALLQMFNFVGTPKTSATDIRLSDPGP